ncbi:methyltransferase, TIGR00027 family [Amycolatopsis arida]|uniref:Methyltransferase, TIGR00027 family n=1 Tax=Amycolatopsis arida TaxID=587909 RepID=A0A1I5PTG5_9PSEU|nr:class I SAM-dependent methyltransferase [Amycolatopsis arida]TDX98600.1 methyltransferase (TIGR00027 family) [Amycolatopsis arida]SFP37362.1 methyltransferase, TIGR00027 family [Amycolatopsis arida]
MNQVKVRLGDAMETAVLTLYGKALDARDPRPILGDTMAADAIERIDYDVTRLRRVERVAASAAARAKHFDGWTREFLAAHERATVVHLAAGLDTRVWRIDPGPGVTWYDVDFPEVVDVRAKLYPERANYRLIGSSVTASEWLERVPTGGPTLVVAEGLTMYLRPEEGHALFRRIADRFPGAVIVFDTHNRLAVWMVGRSLARMFGAPLLRWGIDDPRELERVHPRLRCLDVVNALSAAGTALPLGARVFAALTRPVRPLRDLGLYVRYEVAGQP